MWIKLAKCFARANQPNKGPFSDTSSAVSGSGSRSRLSEYVSDWHPLSVGTSSPRGGEAEHNGPAAEAGMASPLLKLLDSMVPWMESACCCCLCKVAWEERRTTLRQRQTLNAKLRTQTKKRVLCCLLKGRFQIQRCVSMAAMLSTIHGSVYK